MTQPTEQQQDTLGEIQRLCAEVGTEPQDWQAAVNKIYHLSSKALLPSTEQQPAQLWRDLGSDEQPQSGDRCWSTLTRKWTIPAEPETWVDVKHIIIWQRPVTPGPCQACEKMRDALTEAKKALWDNPYCLKLATEALARPCPGKSAEEWREASLNSWKERNKALRRAEKAEWMAHEVRDCRGLFDLKEGESLLFAIERLKGKHAELKALNNAAHDQLAIAYEQLADAKKVRLEYLEAAHGAARKSKELRAKLEQSRQRWIPLSERKPTEADATFMRKGIMPVFVVLIDNDAEVMHGYSENWSDGVTHWSTLPQFTPPADQDEVAFKKVLYSLKSYTGAELKIAMKFWNAALASLRK